MNSKDFLIFLFKDKFVLFSFPFAYDDAQANKCNQMELLKI